MITRKLDRTNDHSRNAERAKNPCAVCGRHVKHPAGWVHIVEGGLEILHPDDEANYDQDDPGNVGCHPVGSRCAKALKGWLLPN